MSYSVLLLNDGADLRDIAFTASSANVSCVPLGGMTANNTLRASQVLSCSVNHTATEQDLIHGVLNHTLKVVATGPSFNTTSFYEIDVQLPLVAAHSPPKLVAVIDTDTCSIPTQSGRRPGACVRFAPLPVSTSMHVASCQPTASLFTLHMYVCACR